MASLIAIHLAIEETLVTDKNKQLTWSSILLACVFMLAYPCAHAAQPSSSPYTDYLEKISAYSTPKSTASSPLLLPSTVTRNNEHGKLGVFLRSALSRADSAVKTKDMSTFSSPFVSFKHNGAVQVYVHVVDASQPQLEQGLSDDGLGIEVINKQLNKIQGWALASAIPVLAARSDVVKITVPSYSSPRAGSVTTQGDKLLKANELRKLGYTGKGIKVGIVSDGANAWRAASASGNLPAKLTTYGTCSSGGAADPRNCQSGGGTCNEGTAMAEIIHDIAPDAELAVAAVSTSLEFIQQINRLASEFEADIIVDDLGFYGEPYFSDGDIAKAVAALPSQVLYISAAGNSAAVHHTGIPGGYNSCCGLNRNIHNFELPGTSEAAEGLYHGFIVPRKSGVVIIMQWDGREYGYPGPVANNDLRLDVFDGRALTTRKIFATSDIDNAASGQYIEALCIYNPEPNPVVNFAMVGYNTAAVRFKMFFLGALAIEYPMNRGSIIGHPGVERAIAVGTINATDAGLNDIAFYSSNGPSHFNYLDASNELISINRSKPDVVAVDGVAVSGAGGFSSDFFGTSAAAPHVAGIAAQLMSVSRLTSSSGVREALLSGSVDLGSKGFDFVYGHGVVDAERALAELSINNPVPAILLLLQDE